MRIWCFVRSPEMLAQGRALPKRDIVDTCFHASPAAGHGASAQTPFPTLWGKTRDQCEFVMTINTRCNGYIDYFTAPLTATVTGLL